jgi:hypothetical protein
MVENGFQWIWNRTFGKWLMDVFCWTDEEMVEYLNARLIHCPEDAFETEKCLEKHKKNIREACARALIREARNRRLLSSLEKLGIEISEANIFPTQHGVGIVLTAHQSEILRIKPQTVGDFFKSCVEIIIEMEKLNVTGTQWATDRVQRERVQAALKQVSCAIR